MIFAIDAWRALPLQRVKNSLRRGEIPMILGAMQPETESAVEKGLSWGSGGTLGCFDRVLFRGYLPLMSGWAMAEFLRSKRIERFTLKPFLLEQAERIKKHAGVMASQTGRPYQYLSEP
jgi:hypothetical protein